jgi:hypothetical protein
VDEHNILQSRIMYPVTSPLQTRIIFTMCVAAAQNITATCFHQLVRLSNRSAILLLSPVVPIFFEVADDTSVEQIDGATAWSRLCYTIEREPTFGVVAQDLKHLIRTQPSTTGLSNAPTYIPSFRLMRYSLKRRRVLRQPFHNPVTSVTRTL